MVGSGVIVLTGVPDTRWSRRLVGGDRLARARVRPCWPAPSPRPRADSYPCGLDATCGEQTGGVRPPPPLRGGASHEAEGRGEAQGGRVGHVRPLAGWHRLRLLRQIGNELVPGVEQFLLVDDVVAVEDGAGSCGRSGAWQPARGRWRGSGCGRRCAGNRGGSGSAPRPPGRRCATPCASGGRGCRRGGRRAGCRGRGVPAAAPGPRRWAARWGGCVPPESSSARARAG